jgi:hypothetical protein
VFRNAGLVLCAAAQVCAAHDVISTKLTWSREVSRIVYKRCASCHREDGTAMPLLTYQDARPWAKAIKEEVLERRMPPWGAVKGYGDFRNDAALTQEEIGIIADWVEGGAPEGDKQYLPAAPVFAPAKAELLKPGISINRKFVLDRDLRLQAVRPDASVADARLTARRPDGSVEPLLWLHNYKRQWNRTFSYREPVLLPKGTILEMSEAMPVILITAEPQPARRTKPYSLYPVSGTAPKSGVRPGVETAH